MPSKDLNDACKVIRDAWDGIKNEFFTVAPGHYLEIDCSYRSPDEQFELFKQGRAEHMGLTPEGTYWWTSDKEKIVTNVDGYKVIGAHNYHPSRAIDVCVVDNQTGKRTWDTAWYKPLIEIATRYGLVEGGTWKSIQDWPHLEVKDYKNYKEEA